MCDNAQPLQKYLLMSVNFHASFAIKPDTPRIGHVTPLNDFINKYPDEDLTPNLIRLAERFEYYRPICGDGNCFYRACVFLYFSVANLRSFEETFLQAPVKDCINAPFDLEEYDVKEVLVYIWRQYLLPMKEMEEFQRRRELRRKLNNSVLLDAFLIAYFRSLNHQHIRKHLGQFSAFIEGDFQTQMRQVLVFGREAQGIELFSMAELLKVKFTIMMVHKENFQQIVYKENGRANFYLFFRPGHYDILCMGAEYRDQVQSAVREKSPHPVQNQSPPRTRSPPVQSTVRNPPERLPTINFRGQQIPPEVVMIKSVIDFKDKEVLVWNFDKIKNKLGNVNDYYQERNRGRPNSQKKEPRARSPRQSKRNNEPLPNDRQEQLRNSAIRLSSPPSPPQSRHVPFQPSTISIPNVKRSNLTIQAVAIVLILVIIGMVALNPPHF